MNKKVPCLIIIGMEAIVVLYLLLKAVFVPSSYLEVTNGDFNSDFSSYEFALRSGGYLVTADYDPALCGEDTYIEIDSHTRDSATRFQPLYLDKAHSTVTGRLYIPLFSSVGDFQVRLENTGTDVPVYKVAISENTVFRFIQMFGILAAFFLIDLVIYLLIDPSFAGHILSEKSLLCLLAILLISCIPLFSDMLYVGHDLVFHLDRIDSLAAAMRDHMLPQHIQSEMLNGYGYETPLFYCDLFIYPAAFMYQYCLLPMRTCYQLYILLINLFTILFSYRFFKTVFDEKVFCVIGVALYTLNVYRLEDIYLRSAVGEYTALVFLPLAAEGIYRIYRKDVPSFKDWMPLGIGMACLLFSHTVTFEMTVLILLVTFIIMLPRLSLKRFLALAAAALTALLLCLWFIVPMIDSMLTLHPVVLDKSYRLQWTGAYLIQIFDPIPNGTGVNNYGTQGNLPLTIGGGLAVGLMITAYFYIKQQISDRITRISFIFALITLWMSTVYFPWDMIARLLIGRLDPVLSVLESVEFVWHYLEFATFFLSICVVGVLIILRKKNRIHFNYVLLTIMSLHLVAVIFFYHDFMLNTSQGVFNEISNKDRMSDLSEDYDLIPGMAGITDNTGIDPSSGDVAVASYEHKDGSWLLKFKNSGDEAKLRLPLFDFGNYHAYDLADGKELLLERDSTDMRLTLTAPGNSECLVEIRYIPPTYWHIAEYISLISLVLLCAAGIITGKTSILKHIKNE